MAVGNRVEVTLYLGFDEKSEKALEVVWKAAMKILEEYGIWVEVVPIHVWIHDPMGIVVSDLPRIEVNGRVVSVGRVPSEDEIIDVILLRSYERSPTEEKSYMLAAIQRQDPVFEDGILC